ncbi:MAG: cardiolipin synthase [Mobilitalea sp.]
MWELKLFGYELYYLFYIFIFYAALGWVYESCLVSLQKKTFVNRGFLIGPVIPIYGCGALLVYMVFWDFRNNLLLVFVGGICLATLLEYITSLVMELLFHTRWWDYSKYPFNLNGRVCLFISLFWGVLTLLMLHIFQPGINYLLEVISRRMGEMIGYVLIPLFVVDIITAVITTVKFDRIIAKLHVLRQDMTEYIGTTKIFETGEETLKRIANLRMMGVFTEVRASFDTWLHSQKINKQNNNLEIMELKPDIETKMKEFFGRYQSIKIQKAYIRLLKAFPTMKVGKREAALGDLKEKVIKKGVRELGKDLREEVKDLSEEVKGTIKGYLSGFLRATIVGLLVIAQFALIIYLSFVLRGFTIYIYTGIQVLSIIIVIALINDNRSSSYKISWICIIAALPITGHIMFMLWGNVRRRKIDHVILKKLQRGAEFLDFSPEVMKQFADKYPTKSRMTKYLESNSFPLTKNNKVEYYSMGETAFEAIFEEIEKAQNFILINFYIVGEGALWDRLHTQLLRKLKDEVKVLFMYDDFGAMLRTPTNFRKSLESEGFEIRVFNPIHKYTDKLYMNYRSHQKIIIVDGNVGFTGGMNLADEYVNLIPRFGLWKDSAVKVEGDAVWGLTVTFLQMWEVSGAGAPMDYNPYRPTKHLEENDVYCQVFSDGPANNPRNPVEDIYKQMIYYAKKVLYITTPYLIIEDDMRDALMTAAISGIDVRIITPFIPDKKNVKVLTNYNYGRLLEAGVRIFEYTPGFIHAKTIITEDSGIVGTINMDYRSFYLQYECGVWICDKETVNTIKEDLLVTMEQCHEVTYEEWMNRPLILKIYQMFLNLFSTLM